MRVYAGARAGEHFVSMFFLDFGRSGVFAGFKKKGEKCKNGLDMIFLSAQAEKLTPSKSG